MNTQLEPDKRLHEFECRSKRYFTKHISWSAIIVATLIGLGISFLLNLFALSIGVTAFVHTATSPQTIAIGGLIALIIIAIASMGTLGWVAGFLGAKNTKCCCPSSCNSESNCNIGCLYGFTAWCLALILAIFMSSSVGKFITNSMAIVNNPTTIIETDNRLTQNVLTTKSINANQNTNQKAVVVNEEEAAKSLAVSAFVTFVLLFIGALSATIAGHCAFNRCLKKHSERSSLPPSKV